MSKLQSFCLLILSSSEILSIEDSVALSQHFISFEAQMVFFPQITHIEYFFIVLLQQPRLNDNYIGATNG